MTAHEVNACVSTRMRDVMNDRIWICVLPRNGNHGVRSRLPLQPSVSHSALISVEQETHTKKPTTLPKPNILPAHALPSSC